MFAFPELDNLYFSEGERHQPCSFILYPNKSRAGREPVCPEHVKEAERGDSL
jgi:hypothetical protein